MHKGACAKNARHRMVEERPSYFSWWNVYLTVAGLALTLLVYLPANLIRQGAYLNHPSAWWIHYLVTPFIIMSCIVSIGVLLTSQALFANNFQHMIEVDAGHITSKQGQGQDRDTVHGPGQSSAPARALSDPSVDSNAISLQVPFVQSYMRSNFMVHVLPAMVGIVVLLLLSIGSLQAADARAVAVVTGVMCIVLWTLYFVLPVTTKVTGETLTGVAKLRHVYCNPGVGLVAGHCLFSLACAVIIPFFVIGRGPKGFSFGPGASPALSLASARSSLSLPAARVSPAFDVADFSPRAPRALDTSRALDASRAFDTVRAPETSRAFDTVRALEAPRLLETRKFAPRALATPSLEVVQVPLSRSAVGAAVSAAPRTAVLMQER